ncbi:MAG: hypothetical protein M1405_03415 [Patescibacteria group bacterium]|nr:hypothetical protein [Patescibacteria group bacterium]
MSEKAPKPLSVIERLRVKNPRRNIASVAVEQLDNPTEMAQFLIQYAQELGRTSQRPETRANPFDTAVELINRMASLYGGEIASRWYELIDTGTVRFVPDHSPDHSFRAQSDRTKPARVIIRPRSLGAIHAASE